jgi:nitroreductase
MYAPNHKLREPWRFVLAIEEGQTRYVDALMELLTARGQFETKTSEQRQQAEQKLREVPVYLTVLCQVQGTPDQQLEDTLATAAMIQNLQLVATERGLGCCWKSGKHWFTPEYASIVNVSGHHAIGHVRYSTAGGNTLENTQPLHFKSRTGDLALAHNWNLVNADSLKHLLEAEGASFQTTRKWTGSRRHSNRLASPRSTCQTENVPKGQVDALLRGAHSASYPCSRQSSPNSK